jgi:putative membrane protein
MWHNMHGFGGGFNWFGLLIIIAIVVIIYLLIRNNSYNRSQSRRASQTPLEILQERLAKGEISKEEYRELKNELENGE